MFIILLFLINVCCFNATKFVVHEQPNSGNIEENQRDPVPLFFVSTSNITVFDKYLAAAIMEYVGVTGWPVTPYNFNEEDEPHPNSKYQEGHYVEWLRTGVKEADDNNRIMVLCDVPSVSTFQFASNALGGKTGGLDPYFVLFEGSPLHEQALMSRAVEESGDASHILLVPTERYNTPHTAAGAILAFVGQKTGRFHFTEVTSHIKKHEQQQKDEL